MKSPSLTAKMFFIAKPAILGTFFRYQCTASLAYKVRFSFTLLNLFGFYALLLFLLNDLLAISISIVLLFSHPAPSACSSSSIIFFGHCVNDYSITILSIPATFTVRVSYFSQTGFKLTPIISLEWWRIHFPRSILFILCLANFPWEQYKLLQRDILDLALKFILACLPPSSPFTDLPISVVWTSITNQVLKYPFRDLKILEVDIGIVNLLMAVWTYLL